MVYCFNKDGLRIVRLSCSVPGWVGRTRAWWLGWDDWGLTAEPHSWGPIRQQSVLHGCPKLSLNIVSWGYSNCNLKSSPNTNRTIQKAAFN